MCNEYLWAYLNQKEEEATNLTQFEELAQSDQTQTRPNSNF